MRIYCGTRFGVCYLHYLGKELAEFIIYITALGHFNYVNGKGIRNGIMCAQFKVLQYNVVFTYFCVSRTKIIVLWDIFHCCLYLNYVESSDRIHDE
jgi:hypothetical protein